MNVSRTVAGITKWFWLTIEGYLSYLLPKFEDIVPTCLGSGAIWNLYRFKVSILYCFPLPSEIEIVVRTGGSVASELPAFQHSCERERVFCSTQALPSYNLRPRVGFVRTEKYSTGQILLHSISWSKNFLSEGFFHRWKWRLANHLKLPGLGKRSSF